MGRTYKRKEGAKKRVPPPDPDIIEKAVKAVNEGGKFKTTAKFYGINVMTLKRLCRNGLTALPGYKVRQVFTSIEEKELGKFLEDMSKMYYGLTVLQFRKLAYAYASKNKIIYPPSWDKSKEAGRDWYRGFVERNGALSLRTPEATSLARSTSFNRTNVKEFFGKLKDVFTRFQFPPERVWNIDETGLTTVHKPAKIIATKGCKQVGKITSAERGELVTVCAAINAAGGHNPPFLVFPRKNWQDKFLKCSPPGSNGSASATGWMTSDVFLKFLEHFVRFTNPTQDRKHLIILDNHESHCSFEALNYCKEQGIVLLTIPPHTSHKLQPLDRTVYGPLKAYYSDAASNYMLNHPGKTITIYDIAELLSFAYPRALAPRNVISGFKVTGIWPFNDDIFTDDEFLTSAVTDRPDPTLIEPPAASVTLSEPNTTTIAEAEEEPTIVRQRMLSTLEPAEEQQPSTSYEPAEEQQPSTSYEPAEEQQPSTSYTSPQEIMPYPKASARTLSSRGRKRGRTRILTDTPEKNDIEEAARMKEIKKKKKEGKIRKSYEEKGKRKLFKHKTPQGDQKRESEYSEEEEEDLKINEEGNHWKTPKKIEGEFVVVKYDEKYYPGLIKKALHDTATISAMKAIGRLWKWPDHPDVLDYSWDAVVAGIEPPTKTSKTRNIYNVPELTAFLY